MDLSRYTLSTHRLLLHVLVPRHAKLTLDYYERNRDFLKEWEPERPPKFYTTTFQKRQLKNDLLKMRSGELFRVWLFKKEDCLPRYSVLTKRGMVLGRTIGTAALSGIVRGCFQSCFLGYKLDKDEQNKGYMGEAIQRLIEFAFTELNLHRIEANIMPRNIRSMRLVERLGFVNEGMSKDYLFINGTWEDHIHMVLLNASWKPGIELR